MKIKILIVSVILMLCLTVSVGAAGYPSYNYLENGGIAAAPQPFKVLDFLFAEDFGGSSFEGAGDLASDENGALYVSETEQNRIAVRYPDGTSALISSFINGGVEDTFSAPSGLFIRDGKLESFFASYYISRKTGVPRAKNNSGNMIIKAGEKSVQDLTDRYIKEVDSITTAKDKEIMQL